jgi:DNA recombination protein RmuC
LPRIFFGKNMPYSNIQDPLLLAAVIGLYVIVLLGILYFALTRSNLTLRQQTRQIEALSIRMLDQGQALTNGLNGLRDEAARQAGLAREDSAARIAGVGQDIAQKIDLLANAQRGAFDGFAATLHEARAASDLAAKTAREEAGTSFGTFGALVTERLSEQARQQTARLDGFEARLLEHRTSTAEDSRALREEVNKAIGALSKSLLEGLETQGRGQTEGLSAAQTQIKDMTEANDRAALALRQTVEGRLDVLRQDNEAKLEQMRVTVDEKLQGTLEQRLGASFTQVNEQLERVFKSVGEMQTIATGVGDLKRVLTNVKARGTWGEATLGMLLEQAMTTEQYAQNVEVKPGSNQRVEYAIRLPNDGDTPVWLPIDAKLPIEDYERLIDASERADVAGIEAAQKGLEKAIRVAAKDISEKYIAPPHTTDFAIMFLPTEGLFAEVVRRPGLVDVLQRDHKVLVSGPTTLMATLTSLRMGFRTLAIQQRSSEVWQVLSNVKQEFEKFGGVLKKVEEKLDQAKNVVQQARTRENVLGRQLRAVESLPGSAPQAALPFVSPAELIEDVLDDLDGGA